MSVRPVRVAPALLVTMLLSCLRTSLASPFPESSHPYPRTCDLLAEVSVPGAPRLRLVFDRQSALAPLGYLHVSDKTGVPVPGSPFRGQAPAGLTLEVPGDRAQIRLVSRSPRPVTAFGYRVQEVAGIGGLRARPNLKVLTLTAPPRGTIGGEILATWEIVNSGSSPARSVVTGFYLSQDDRLAPGDLALAGATEGLTLLPGASYASSPGGSPIPIPSTVAPGRYHLIVATDDPRVIDEEDESDNRLSSAAIEIDHPRDSRYQLLTSVTPEVSGVLHMDPASPDGFFPRGARVVIRAEPDPDHVFDHFSGDTGMIPRETPGITVVMVQSRTITAHFRPIVPGTHLLTIGTSPAGSGTIELDPAIPGLRYPAGSVVRLRAVPNHGRVFLRWRGDVDPGEILTNPLPVSMNHFKILQAEFGEAQTSSRLAVVTRPVSAGNVLRSVAPDAEDRYSTSASVILAAIPVRGWRFLYFEVEGPGSTTYTELQNPVTLPMPVDRTVIAVFAPEEPAGTVLESRHPYRSRTTTTTTASVPEARSLLLIFDRLTSVERTRDFIHILDAHGVPVPGSPFSGDILGGAQITVPGDRVTITLVSDLRGTAWGYRAVVREAAPAPGTFEAMWEAARDRSTRTFASQRIPRDSCVGRLTDIQAGLLHGLKMETLNGNYADIGAAAELSLYPIDIDFSPAPEIPFTRQQFSLPAFPYPAVGISDPESFARQLTELRIGGQRGPGDYPIRFTLQGIGYVRLISMLPGAAGVFGLSPRIWIDHAMDAVPEKFPELRHVMLRYSDRDQFTMQILFDGERVSGCAEWVLHKEKGITARQAVFLKAPFDVPGSSNVGIGCSSSLGSRFTDSDHVVTVSASSPGQPVRTAIPPPGSAVAPLVPFALDALPFLAMECASGARPSVAWIVHEARQGGRDIRMEPFLSGFHTDSSADNLVGGLRPGEDLVSGTEPLYIRYSMIPYDARTGLPREVTELLAGAASR